MLPLDRTQLDTRVVIGQNIVIAVLLLVVRKLGGFARGLGLHGYGAKLLHEELVVIHTHHCQSVEEPFDRDGWVHAHCWRWRNGHHMEEQGEGGGGMLTLCTTVGPPIVTHRIPWFRLPQR